MAGVTGTDAKSEARARARAARRDGPRADPHALARQGVALVQSLSGPPRVSCYLSYGTEPETRPLVAALESAGFEVLLPRVRDSDLEWTLSSAPRRVSPMGIEEGDGPAVDLEPVRALLIPALAVTPSGDRLGKGGGFYDRTLAALRQPATLVAAIVRDSDVVPDVPTQEHDQRVGAIVTPSAIWWVPDR